VVAPLQPREGFIGRKHILRLRDFAGGEKRLSREGHARRRAAKHFKKAAPRINRRVVHGGISADGTHKSARFLVGRVDIRFMKLLESVGIFFDGLIQRQGHKTNESGRKDNK
jgi:hypothetical protein